MATQIQTMTISKKGSALYLRKRVPARFATVDGRTVVWIALNTDSMKEAEAKAVQVWDAQLQGWESIDAATGKGAAG